MFAVVKTGGKQYRVSKGDVITVEKLAGEVGDNVHLDDVLLVCSDHGDLNIGAPLVDGAYISAEILDQGRGNKVLSFKKRRRKNSKWRKGHRQCFTALKVIDLALDGKTKKEEKHREADKPALAKPGNSNKAATQEAKKPAETSTKPNKKPDDLKKISGIGPVLESKLHAFGIISYRQIAELTKENIEEINETLRFSGRIERENWVEQAKKLLS